MPRTRPPYSPEFRNLAGQDRVDHARVDGLGPDLNAGLGRAHEMLADLQRRFSFAASKVAPSSVSRSSG